MYLLDLQKYSNDGHRYVNTAEYLTNGWEEREDAD